MDTLQMIAETARRGTTEMMARHNRSVEHLKFVIDQETRRLNKLADAGVSNAALAAEAVSAFAAVAMARAELP